MDSQLEIIQARLTNIECLLLDALYPLKTSKPPFRNESIKPAKKVQQTLVSKKSTKSA
jgi:hypothetical protein